MIYRKQHKLSGTGTYITWMGMLQRCLNTACNKYPEYGGSGIGVCEQWKDFSRRKEISMTVITVTVHFDGDVPALAQSKAMFDFERQLRVLSGLDVRVFKERMEDDSKLRVITDLRRKK